MEVMMEETFGPVIAIMKVQYPREPSIVAECYPMLGFWRRRSRPAHE